jgi:hypothetical protein
MMEEIVRAWTDEAWPLSVAVCWIATRGDVSKLEDFNALETAADELLQALKSGRIVARGVAEGGDDLPEKVARDKFTTAVPFAADTPLDEIFSDAPLLEWRALAEHRPDLNDGDRIARRGKPKWKRLEVYRREAQEQWPEPIKPGDERDAIAANDVVERLEKDNGAARKPAFALAQFKREYEVYIAKAKNDGRETVEAQDCKAFPNVPRDIVREQRRATVPEWCTRGRPKKTRGI